MAAYSLSHKASEDIDAIYERSIINFGMEQARSYLLGLHDLLETLAAHPGHGRLEDRGQPPNSVSLFESIT